MFSTQQGEEYEPCNFFAKNFQTVCPNAWIEKWNEQREKVGRKIFILKKYLMMKRKYLPLEKYLSLKKEIFTVKALYQSSFSERLPRQHLIVTPTRCRAVGV